MKSSWNEINAAWVKLPISHDIQILTIIADITNWKSLSTTLLCRLVYTMLRRFILETRKHHLLSIANTFFLPFQFTASNGDDFRESQEQKLLRDQRKNGFFSENLFYETRRCSNDIINQFDCSKIQSQLTFKFDSFFPKIVFQVDWISKRHYFQTRRLSNVRTHIIFRPRSSLFLT